MLRELLMNRNPKKTDAITPVHNIFFENEWMINPPNKLNPTNACIKYLSWNIGKEYEIKNIPKKGIKNQHKTTMVFLDTTLFLSPHNIDDKSVKFMKPLTNLCEFRNKVKMYDIDTHPLGGLNQVPR